MGDNAEFSLAELVQDPLVGLMMKSDGVDRRAVERLFERVAQERARAAGGDGSRPRDNGAARCTTC